MANQPPSDAVAMAAALRKMATGVTAYTAGGGTWPGPTAVALTAAATELETRAATTDSAYVSYKQALEARNQHRLETATPLFRQGVQAAYLAVGKRAAELLTFGLAPVDPPSSRIPDPPAGLSVRETSTSSVLVDWDPVSGAERYHVYVGPDLEHMTLYGSATESELEVRGLTEGTKYFFYVTALSSLGESAPSNFTSRRTL